MQSTKGAFITFEGGEGSGKSTQARLFVENLKAAGHDAVLTREPGGTPEAEKIRSLLVDSDGGAWSPFEEALLLFAGRSHHYRNFIKPAVDEGKIVICDRFTDSTIAYQGYGLGLGSEKIQALNALTMNEIKPDKTFLLDLSVEDGLARSKKRLSQENSNEDKYENLDISFHERVRSGFLELANNEKERFIVLDALKSLEELSLEIIGFWKT